MQIKLRTLLLVLPLVVASCSDPFHTGIRPTETISVTVGSDPRIGIQPNSRTSIESDGQTIRWNTGDKIALWAVNAQGQAAIAGQTFDLRHYNASFNAAKFTANVPQLPEGIYNYYALSPLPTSINGTKATYTLPAVQEFKTAELGEALTDLPYDIMVADPLEGKALVEGDNSDIVNLAFRHKVHLLKVTVESNSLNQKVSEVVLTFPSPVVGTLTIDAANPDAEPVLTNSSNTLIIRFDEPVTPGTTVIAAIAPINVPPSENVQIVSYGETHESLIRNIAGKDFAAGRTTPLFYNIPSQGRQFTRLSFSLPADKGTNTLGETITGIKLTAPENEMLGLTKTLEFTPDADGKHSIHLKPLWQDISGATIAVEYESESAIVSNTITMSQITAHAENNVEFSIPYLMAEDFSDCSNFSGSTATGNAGGVELTSAGMPGWYAGARCQGYAGTCANLQHYNNIGGPYHSRISSCTLSDIKPDKTISVKLIFNSDWKKNKSTSMNLIVGRSTGTSLNDDINSNTKVSMTNNSAASRTNIPTLHNVTISGFTNNQSISWKTDGANKGLFNYEDVFIDNIKVSIVK